MFSDLPCKRLETGLPTHAVNLPVIGLLAADVIHLSIFISTYESCPH